MRFKGEVVWIRADDTGALVTDGSGRAEMKYRETDEKSYRPFAGNLLPDEGGGEGGGAAPAVARPSATRARKPTAGASKPHATNGTGPPPSAGGALELWTDGACSGNPGPMGIGVVAIDGAKRREVSEYLGVGTNNIAELTAIERALDTADTATDNDRHRRMRIYTDSAYSIGVLSKGWKAKANQELVARIKRRLAAYPNVGVREGLRPRRRPGERALRRPGAPGGRTPRVERAATPAGRVLLLPTGPHVVAWATTKLDPRKENGRVYYVLLVTIPTARVVQEDVGPNAIHRTASSRDRARDRLPRLIVVPGG